MSPTTASLGRSWRWSPWPLAGLYLVLVAVQFRQIVGATYLNADAASAPVIGQLFTSAPDQVVGLGQLGWYSTLIFELTTRWLPFHRQLWEAAPYALALTSAGLLGWAACRVAGRWAAAITAALVVCASPRTLELLFSFDDHSPTWFSLALLAAFVVLVQERGTVMRSSWLALATVLTGAVVGVNAASDDLLLVAGLAPLLIAGFGTWLLGPTDGTRNAAWTTFAVAALAGLSALATATAMHSAGVTTSRTLAFASPEQIVANSKLWWQSISVLGNGNFFGQRIGPTAVLQAACAALGVVAVLLGVRLGWRRARAGRLGSPAGDARMTAYVLFWGSSAVFLSAAYILSSAPVDLQSDRYLVGLLYAAAATAPLLGMRSLAGQVVVVAGTFAFALAGVIDAAKGTATRNPAHFPTGRMAAEVASVAEREQLARGYAGYWDAAPITWATDFRVRVYPLYSCGAGRLCPAPLHFISGWYAPHGGRSFLLTDPTQPFVPAPPAYLGAPSAAHRIGQLTMYVYPYDIATQLHA